MLRIYPFIYPQAVQQSFQLTKRTFGLSPDPVWVKSWLNSLFRSHQKLKEWRSQAGARANRVVAIPSPIDEES